MKDTELDGWKVSGVGTVTRAWVPNPVGASRETIEIGGIIPRLFIVDRAYGPTVKIPLWLIQDFALRTQMQPGEGVLTPEGVEISQTRAARFEEQVRSIVNKPLGTLSHDITVLLLGARREALLESALRIRELEADLTRVPELQAAAVTERERAAELESQLVTHAGVTSSHQQTIAWLKTQADKQAATIVDLSARLTRSTASACEDEKSALTTQVTQLRDTIAANAAECERHVIASNRELTALRTANAAIATENLRLSTADAQLCGQARTIDSLRRSLKEQTCQTERAVAQLAENAATPQEGIDALTTALNKANARIAELDGICQAFSNVRHVELKHEDDTRRLSVQLQTAIADRGKMHSLLKECQKERSLLIKALGRGV